MRKCRIVDDIPMICLYAYKHDLVYLESRPINTEPIHKEYEKCPIFTHFGETGIIGEKDRDYALLCLKAGDFFNNFPYDKASFTSYNIDVHNLV